MGVPQNGCVDAVALEPISNCHTKCNTKSKVQPFPTAGLRHASAIQLRPMGESQVPLWMKWGMDWAASCGGNEHMLLCKTNCEAHNSHGWRIVKLF